MCGLDLYAGEKVQGYIFLILFCLVVQLWIICHFSFEGFVKENSNIKLDQRGVGGFCKIGRAHV